MHMLKSSTSRRMVCLWNNFGIVEGGGGVIWSELEYFQMSADRKSARQRRSKVSGDHRTCVMKPLENYFDVPHLYWQTENSHGGIAFLMSRRAENIVSETGGL